MLHNNYYVYNLFFVFSHHANKRCCSFTITMHMLNHAMLLWEWTWFKVWSSLFHDHISEGIAQCVIFAFEYKRHASDIIHIIHGELHNAQHTDTAYSIASYMSWPRILPFLVSSQVENRSWLLAFWRHSTEETRVYSAKRVKHVAVQTQCISAVCKA